MILNHYSIKNLKISGMSGKMSGNKKIKEDIIKKLKNKELKNGFIKALEKLSFNIWEINKFYSKFDK
jgi:hypothetical protein